MTIKHDGFALVPQVCCNCKRRFIWEPFRKVQSVNKVLVSCSNCYENKTSISETELIKLKEMAHDAEFFEFKYKDILIRINNLDDKEKEKLGMYRDKYGDWRFE